LREINSAVNSIALIGASARPERDGFKFMEALITEGNDVIPVNPSERDSSIPGRLCYSSLSKYKVPKYFLLEANQKTSTGKVQKFELRRRASKLIRS
jgi:acyl-CoA synthetase (AMP-forming)/AMP-acid ligase II